MKKLYTLFIAQLIVYSALTQTVDPCESCLTEGISFTSQSQIDSFPINYPGCVEIEGNVVIMGADIFDLTGLNSLCAINGNLRIGSEMPWPGSQGCPNLSSLSGLNNLTSIGGYLKVCETGLLNFIGLDSLTFIGGELIIIANSLNSLDGLQNLSFASITNIKLIYNYSLETCNTDFICEYLSNPNGIIEIHHNATGCDSPPEIAKSCQINMPCHPYGNYYFYSQEEVDSFEFNYPNCSELVGLVRIGESNISNLNGLNQITSILGDLEIHDVDGLSDLAGLDNISYISGNLEVTSNFFLLSLDGLNNLTTVDGSIRIGGNDSLLDLMGLNNLSLIGGGYFHGNHCLTSLNGLQSLLTINGILRIDGHDSLRGLLGLNNLTTIEGNLELWGDNLNLEDLSGLESLTYIGGDFLLIDMNKLESLNGLEGLSSIGGSFFIDDNCALTDLMGLNNLTSLGGDLRIEHTTVLESLSGLDNLTSLRGIHLQGNESLNNISSLLGINQVNGDLLIDNNDALISLAGLDNLNSIDGHLAIGGNKVLQDLSELNNIESASIKELFIISNDELSFCSIKSICEYLDAQYGGAIIEDNTWGCNSPEEVQDSCEAHAGIIDGMPLARGLAIYPNPSQSSIRIELPIQPSKNTTLTLTSTNGKQLITQSITEPQTEIDISYLPVGIYIVKLWNDKDVMLQKVIKQ